MNPTEVLERLRDRFRLLAGSRRGLERHQTLRDAVVWSYDLLDDDEHVLLDHCSVFAGGFDVVALAHVGGGLDEYLVLDGLDSLVRKSLITTEQVAGRSRYGLLETIRAFGEERLAAADALQEARDRHVRHFADQAVAHWEMWDGPGQAIALDWIEVELANLRAAFRWASTQHDVAAACAIVAHGVMLGFTRSVFEPVVWAEEVVPLATAADVRQLPRVLTAASVCAWTGRPDEGVGLAQAAARLGLDPRYDPFPHGWAQHWEALSHTCTGRFEEALAVYTALLPSTGPSQVLGLAGRAMILSWLGHTAEARDTGDEAVRVAKAYANPFLIGFALFASAAPYARHEPARALGVLRGGPGLCARPAPHLLGSSHPPRGRTGRSGPRQGRPSARALRHGDRLAPPEWQPHRSGDHAAEPRRSLRAAASARCRGDPLRQGHRHQQHASRHPASRCPAPPRDARRRSVRAMRGVRGGPRVRRGRTVRPRRDRCSARDLGLSDGQPSPDR